MKDILILLDAGHGVNTPGKRSPKLPDGRQLFEWEYTRMISNRIVTKLHAAGIRVELIVPEDMDISLSERANRANKLYDNEKKKGRSALLISIHGNAAGSGQWMNAQGWEVWTTKGNTNSDKFAELLCNEFASVFPDKKLRTDKSDGDGDKENNFTVIYKAKCPAVLTENFFYDNEDECRFMLTDDCVDRVASLHVRAITKWLS